jgi:hypothetical protein
MSSETSTDRAAFQPWQFFVVTTMLAATAGVLVARETSFANLVLVSIAILSVGLVGAAVHRTLWPLASPDEPTANLPTLDARKRQALEREKNLLLRTIKELEFDRAMGKIAESDFTEMVDRLRNRAIGLLKQLDLHQPEWREQIERELARRLAARANLATDARSPIEAHATTVAVRLSCACGTANDADARFCKSCGAPLVPRVEASSDGDDARTRS